LAPKVAQDVMNIISYLKEQNIAVLVVEQNAQSALEVSDRAYVMDRGRIVYEGQAAELNADTALRKQLIGI
jgi:branched-chain amino acid transport system ATP-binding protein